MEADPAGNLERFVDHVEFGAAPNGESFGRWPNGTGRIYPMLWPTLDPAQGENSGPRVGPVVISEIMYNPGNVIPNARDLEYLEIYNPGPWTADLTDWRIRGDVSLDFPAGTTLGPRSVLVVASFPPDDLDRMTIFRTSYGIDPSVQIVGGFSGRLSNEGGTVRLERPDEPPPDAPMFVPHVLEDAVDFHDEAPWPTEPDGAGLSLHRLEGDGWGHDAAAWMAAWPSPGEAPLLNVAEVVGRYVFYHHSVFDDGSTHDGAMAVDKESLLPGGTATFANYTSYSRGINGVMIDVEGLPESAVLNAGDFIFRVGNDDTTYDWDPAPTPTAITVRPGQGVDGSSRVTITWADDAILNQWLQVTLLAGEETNLAEDDVFYFGNAVGESGDSTADARVTAEDVLLARNNPRDFLNPAPIDLDCDYNRDARVNATDVLIARSNQTHLLNALKLITPETGEPPLTGSLVISEFMAYNVSVLADEDGLYSDWIEIHNGTDEALSLGGWYLTDEAGNLTKWRFPNVTIESDFYLVVFASGKDSTVPGSELHTNFTLKASTPEYLALVQPDGITIEFDYGPTYLPQFADISYGWSYDLSSEGYFTHPTPWFPPLFGPPVPDPMPAAADATASVESSQNPETALSHDVVFAELSSGSSATAKGSWDPSDWLFTLEQPDQNARSSTNDAGMDETAEELLKIHLS